MHRSCLNTQFEALFRSLRFTYEAYILGLIQMEAARLRILTFYALHTTLIPLHELKLDRSVAAFPTLYASHTTLIPLHNWKNAAQARPPADSRFTYDAYIVALIEGMLGRQNFPCNDSSYNNDSNITGI